MGYAVLHLDKAPGNEVRMTAHIERTQMPSNAIPSLTYRNEELVEFPEGVADRTEAINYRLDHAGLTRKIGTNQVRAIRIMLTGSHDDMKRIAAEGRIKEWCADNLDWLRKTYGEDNVVSAVLHLDESTPHIHASVVPIVTGERRKVREKKTDEPGKRKYRKKSTARPRLCVVDLMTRVKLKGYQDVVIMDLPGIYSLSPYTLEEVVARNYLIAMPKQWRNTDCNAVSTVRKPGMSPPKSSTATPSPNNRGCRTISVNCSVSRRRNGKPLNVLPNKSR